MRLAALTFAALALTACATSSHVMVGNARQPVDPATVKIYVKPPEKYDVIALVRGASVTGWTQQQDTNNAVASLKREAAKLGANGVLLGSLTEGGNATMGLGTSSTGQTTLYSGGYSSKAEVTGQAIYVSQE